MRKNPPRKNSPKKSAAVQPHFSPRTQDYGLASQNIRHNPSSGFGYSEAEAFRDERSANPNIRYVPGESSRDELREWEDYDQQGRKIRDFRRSEDISRHRHYSDEELADFVHDVLSKHPDIDVSQLNLQVDEGVITLRGLVETRRMKRLIEDVIVGLPGVHDVQNRIAIVRPDPDRRRIARSLT